MNGKWKVFGVYTLVTLIVMLPLLRPGFILTLDMIFTPNLPMPESVTSSYLFRTLLHHLNTVIPSDILQKLILISILLLSGIGMHRLVKSLGSAVKGNWGVFAAGIFFMINPFTYSRFMAGQSSMLLGYALLPWFVRLLFDFGRRPQLKTALKLGALAAIVGIISIHTLIPLALISLVAGAVTTWHNKQNLKLYMRYGGIALALFLVVSSYWLVPLALGKGTTSDMIGQFTAADTAAFATAGENPLARLGNIVRLQGFWAEERGLYLLPQDRVVLWGLAALIIIGLVVRGGVALWRRRPQVLVILAVSGLLTMLIAAGLAEPITRHLPLLSGYREPHKLVALLAVVYAVLLAYGVNVVLAGVRRRSEAAHAAVAILVLLLPFWLARTMLLGFDGQLSPRQYPADWYSLNDHLKQDSDDYAAVFLPWHQYMSFQFAGRIIANPAPTFFARPVFASTDPELGGATSGRTSDRQQQLHQIITARDQTGLAQKLAANNVKYIILAKDFDYQRYNYLASQPLFTPVKDYPTVTLYQNQAWRNP